MAADIVVANMTASLSYDGKAVTLRRGMTTARVDHPIVQAHPEMFSPLHVDFEVKEARAPEHKTETASSAPGERRSVRPSVARKPAPK